MRALLRYTLPILAILVGGLFVLYLLFGRPAPVPEVFAEGLTMEEARQRAEDLDRPMLVFASADWCIPCQFMKRGALTDERVAAAIRARTVPVYFDVTRMDEAVQTTAEELNVSSLPALILIRDGREIARLEGDRPAVELLTWLGNI